MSATERAAIASIVALGAWAGPAAAGELYTWVDEGGVLHFTNREATVKAAVEQPEDGFGGEAPRVVRLPSGEERTAYPADVRTYDHLFQAAAEHYALPFAYLKAVAKVESNFNPRARSRADAKGLMQLIDDTAALVGVEDPYDPEQSIFGGARYLRMLANQFDGDLELTLAAYNAGPDRVRRLGRVPAIPETTQYVRRVLAMYRYYRGEGAEEERAAAGGRRARRR